jgi:hypothetical protein
MLWLLLCQLAGSCTTGRTFEKAVLTRYVEDKMDASDLGIDVCRQIRGMQQTTRLQAVLKIEVGHVLDISFIV